MLSPAGAGAKLNIFIFHRVHPTPDPLAPGEPDAARFDAMLGFLRRWCHVLPLGDAVRRLRDGTLPPASASVTFDDGYADNLTIAAPLLAKHDIAATVFVAPGYLDGGRMWNDTVIETIREFRGEVLDLTSLGLPAVPVGTAERKRAAIETLLPLIKYRPLEERTVLADAIGRMAPAALPRDLMLSSAQLKTLAALPQITIGAHTRMHPILASIPAEQARAEIADSRRELETLVQRPVDLFAYPNGRPGKDYREEHVQMVRSSGFRAAVSTAQGVADRIADPYQLPRFTPWGRTTWRFATQLARQMMQPSPAAVREVA